MDGKASAGESAKGSDDHGGESLPCPKEYVNFHKQTW
jgi:hypothetical protein